VNSTNALDNSFEELVDQSVDLIDFTNFQDFLEFGQEEGFLDTVSKWPIFQKSFQEWESKGSIFSKEQH